MEFEATVKKTVQAKYLQARCGARYWEDATVNGVADEDGSLIPLRHGEYWCPLIDLETGQIAFWPTGTVADIHYKVCDDGAYKLLDAGHAEVSSKTGYVPSMLSPGGSGFGDYVIMWVDGDGKIANWNADLSYFAK